MRAIEFYRNGVLAGTLTEENRKSYVFRYTDAYVFDANAPAISVTMPKTRTEYKSEVLFPFFVNMLSEGVNRKLQSKLLKIDENENFGFLLATARYDTIEAVTVKPITEP